MLKITKFYERCMSKALCQSFHQNVAESLQETGLAQEPELKEPMARYLSLTEEMKDLVSYYHGLDSTPALNDTMKSIDTQFRYIRRMLQTLSLNRQIISQEEYNKFEHEILDIFPASILRRAWPERLGKLNVLITHLRNDWMPLLEKTELKDSFLQLEEQVQSLGQTIVQRVEEKAATKQGNATRVMNELYETYTLFCLYIEAWSNTDSKEEYLQQRQQRATDCLRLHNTYISKVRHSLAVARSNRKRESSTESSTN